MDKKNLTIIFLTTLMAVMGVASIIPAFPSIREHFNLTPTQVTLLIVVFTFPGIFLSPVAGALADKLGRKTILIPSLFLFGIAGLGCFFTNDWKILLALRFFQGLAAAPLGSLNVTLIGDLFDGEKRGEVMGYNVSVLSTGTAIYPFIGGTLALAGWQFPFILPILAIPTALLTIFWLKNPEPKKKQNLKEYLTKTWKIVNQKTVWGLFIINVLVFVVLYGAVLSYLPQLMAERFQASSFQIGSLIGGFSVITAITSSQFKWINRKINPKKQLTISFILYIISMVVLSAANETWQLIIPLATFGMAQGILLPGIQTLLVGFAPLSERAGFMSIYSMVLRLGQTFGPVFIGIFYTLGGVGIAFIGGALVALIMLVVSFLMVKI
ncbi:MAG: MFS transporter [Prolixibacteraceae bacterium]|jgi:MFS transporter, ACDE family, multidrug resistance protein|nr:MFS transporter [Prolixibacteraceae bacterium]MBT6005182.1 MFS transporter [Prolixibacteraceae bacterium]MBT7000769.1 MFS transporter [Prolixibacteraceae bacterium]MBT7393598.1 MFS transporter [Prolixibacteraceae bacterium]